MMKRLAVILIMASMAAPSFGQLAGYWNFNEGSGTTVADSSGKGKNGVLQKSGSDYPLWIAGHDGNGAALRFNTAATSNWVSVDIGTSDALATPGGAFTISMWVRSDQVDDWVLRNPTSNWRWLIYTNSYDVELALDPNSTADYDPWDYFSSDLTSAWYQIPFPAGYEDWGQNYTGLWYHLAITYDGNYLKKYVNGYLVYAVGAPTGTLATATSDLFIASMSDGSGYFAGDLDDIAVWTGTYLPDTEITKLVNGTGTPLTVADHAQEPPLPVMNYVMEGDIAWNSGGTRTLWSPSFSWDVSLTPNASNTIWMASSWWWSGSVTTPGGRVAVWDWNKWFPATLNDVNIYENTHTPFDAATHGMAWIDPSWSGMADANVAKFAAYVNPTVAVCQKRNWYQPYDASPTRGIGWEDKPYWKTYARVAGENTQGCSFRVRVYTYDDPCDKIYQAPATEPNRLTFIGEAIMPLSGVDHQWQEFKFLLPKAPTICGSIGGNWWTTSHWFEASVVGGNANTILYIDELSPISDRYDVNILDGDFDYDAHVGLKDLDILANEWIRTNYLEPRSGGMLTNGDFYANIGDLNMANDDSNSAITPTGWTFTGTADKGIQNMSKRGYMNYADSAITTPMGGSVAAYIISDAVLQQITTATMVSGHTYYAMAYVMTRSWEGWKDTATLTLQANGAMLAGFDRVLSIDRWRPVYGTYTATPSDAGKPITIRLSYTNSHTTESSDPGYMYIGYVYVGDTMPNEWPEKRQNLLVNGGFEDLTEVNNISPALYHSLTAADNYGGWFTSSIHPTIPGWVYDVTAGYDFNNKAGLWSSGFYGSPLPTSGMHDITFYLNNNLILGQVVGPLTAGTTYYLDTACGVVTDAYILDISSGGMYWPSPAPKLRLELWRIPAGVTDGTVINSAIASSNPNYVRVAETNVPATGDVLGGNSSKNPATPASKWQLLGTSYTATSADTSMYVRIRGSGPATPHPSFAFSDVYLSTAKRLVPGGEFTYNLSSSSMKFDVLGPYNNYHAITMDMFAADVDGNGLVNFMDLATMANNWLQSSFFTDATGATDN